MSSENSVALSYTLIDFDVFVMCFLLILRPDLLIFYEFFDKTGKGNKWI